MAVGRSMFPRCDALPTNKQCDPSRDAAPEHQPEAQRGGVNVVLLNHDGREATCGFAPLQPRSGAVRDRKSPPLDANSLVGRNLDASDRGFASKNKSIACKHLTACNTAIGRFGRKIPEHLVVASGQWPVVRLDVTCPLTTVHRPLRRTQNDWHRTQIGRSSDAKLVASLLTQVVPAIRVRVQDQ